MRLNWIIIRTSLAVWHTFLDEPLRWAMLASLVKLATVNPTGPAPTPKAVDHLQPMDAWGDPPTWAVWLDNDGRDRRPSNFAFGPWPTRFLIAPVAPNTVV